MKTRALFLAVMSVAMFSGCASKSDISSPVATAAAAPVAPATKSVKDIRELARQSLVVVKYTLDAEAGKTELQGIGFVARDDGTVAFSMGIVPNQFPDQQITEMKIIVPPGVAGVDEVEYDAVFLGRDVRADLAYAKAKTTEGKPDRQWTAMNFSDAAVEIGDEITSVGLLPESAGYTAFARQAAVSAKLRGPTPLILTSGLAGVGSVVFNNKGQVVGITTEFGGQSALLNNPGREDAPGTEMAKLMVPPVIFVPISDFLVSLNDVPVEGKPRPLPWMGIAQMTGLKKDVAEVYGLTGTAAVQVGDVVKNFAADTAGMKAGDIIVSYAGQPLVRGDTEEELPDILLRKIGRLNVGDTATFGVVRKKGDAPKDVTVTLTERPMQANKAKRFFAEDLGYTVRELVFDDKYARKLDDNFKGVTVAFVKQASSAAAGQLRRGDVITKLNQTAITDVEQFKSAYDAFRKSNAKDAVVLEVYRGTGTETLRIQPPQ
jgi:S1-C subfamily serine protease